VAGSELPVVCLPGLARTSADFHALALALSNDEARPRRCSPWTTAAAAALSGDKDWRNYDVRVEFGDVLQVLTAAGIAEAVFVGTSRGGLITMALAAARPALIRAAVLNDIGPVIERSGLLRIRAYVGKLPQPSTFAEAAAILRKLSGGHFPAFDDAQWEALARGTCRRSRAAS
jgi:pimeloyl-ACP methyl ester carboxylesterase